MRLRSLLAMVITILALIAVTTPAMLAQTAPVDRPASSARHLWRLGDVVVALANLVITAGDLQGQMGATPVEQSGTVVQFAIADFLAATTWWLCGNRRRTARSSPVERLAAR